jgi:hypothetical protein
MSARLRLFAAAAAALLAVLLARGAAAAVAAAVAGIVLTANSGLGFGQIVATPSPGTVTVTPAGLRSATGGVLLGSGLGVTAASFTATGDPNASFSLLLPTAATLCGGGGSMRVDTFTSSPGGSGVLGPGGTQAVSVGATLHVGAGQRPAAYLGTYDVIVAYN